MLPIVSISRPVEQIRNAGSPTAHKSSGVCVARAGAGVAWLRSMATPRSLLICAAVIAILPAAAAVAQNGRDDGIKAFMRGDYVEAARILGPLAEDAQSPDQTARLIIGMLNDSGYAGQGGTSRACVLYGAAAATPGPFTEPAVLTTIRRVLDATPS